MTDKKYDFQNGSPKLLQFMKQVVMTLEPFGFKLRTMGADEAIQRAEHLKNGGVVTFEAISLPNDFKRICGFKDENDPLAIIRLSKHQRRKQGKFKVRVTYILYDYRMQNGRRVGGGPIMNPKTAENWLIDPDNVLHYYTEMKKILNTTELNHDDIDILGI